MTSSQLSNTELVVKAFEILKNSNVSRSNFNRFLKNHYSDLHIEISKRTRNLDKFKNKIKNGKFLDISIFERLFCLRHNLDDRPKCKQCKSEYVSRFIKKTNSYSKWCSAKCQASDPECIKASKSTRKLKYGNCNFNNSDKSKTTRFKNNNGSWHSKDFATKVKETKKRNHGVENYVNVGKAKLTLQKHIVENPNFWHDRSEKSKLTKIMNGHEPTWNNREKFKQTLNSFSESKKARIIEKRQATCLGKYGIDSIGKVPEIRSRIEKTNFGKYGNISSFVSEKARSNGRIKLKTNAWNNFKASNSKLEIKCTFDEFIACKENERTKLWTWECKSCHKTFEAVWMNWRHRRCPFCDRQNTQNEVYAFINSLGACNDLQLNNRKVLDGFELDIYSKSLNFAVEFDGLFWHSLDPNQKCNKLSTSRNYHLNKTKLCESKGLHLVHLFEDEWANNEKLCRSKLKKILSPTNIRHINASECTVKLEVNEKFKRKFLEKYSLSGDDNSSIRHGLVYHGKCIAMMTFRKCRVGSKFQWCISNYCEMNNIVVVNGFERLLGEFESRVQPKSICYFLDRRWQNEIQEMHNLKLVETLPPQLWWVARGTRYHESEFSKDKAKKFFKKFDETKSFLENALGNNIWRICDCGRLVFSK